MGMWLYTIQSSPCQETGNPIKSVLVNVPVDVMLMHGGGDRALID
jgi:hypothetical protein